jgi:hypothetical protein
MVVLLMKLEVFGQVTDSLAQERDLHLGGARVTTVTPVLSD